MTIQANAPKTIAIYATDTMADWEYAHITAEVTRAEQARPGRFELRWVGDGTAPVRSLGGLEVTPTLDLDELVGLPGLAALVIPGADTFGEGHERLLATVDTLVQQKVPVAGICGATMMLARGGFLDERDHTSNAAEVLAYTGYAGGERYQDQPVVTSDGITTGSGVRAVAFSAEVFRITGLYPAEIVDPWERLYTGGSAEDFFALMEASNAFANS